MCLIRLLDYEREWLGTQRLKWFVAIAGIKRMCHNSCLPHCAGADMECKARIMRRTYEAAGAAGRSSGQRARSMSQG